MLESTVTNDLFFNDTTSTESDKRGNGRAHLLHTRWAIVQASCNTVTPARNAVRSRAEQTPLTQDPASGQENFSLLHDLFTQRLFALLGDGFERGVIAHSVRNGCKKILFTFLKTLKTLMLFCVQEIKRVLFSYSWLLYYPWKIFYILFYSD
jgi:hypothetical protein